MHLQRMQCSLSSLAERPPLVENLFVTRSYSPEGVYRVRFCKNGEWVNVTVDDWFPCFPGSGPIYSRARGNELWVLLLEKAYAKLHGNYALVCLCVFSLCPSCFCPFSSSFLV